jgi:endonuclease I
VTPGGECGNYAKEGDCYNREHLWPKSWFGGFDYGQNAQTDLYELWPSDGYVNGLRGDLPFGAVKSGTITYQSTNGCKIGTCANQAYSGKCFEPADLYKGDFARSYFYLSTAYMNKWSCCDTPGTNGSSIKSWMENELRGWHAADPVDESEIRRNDEIYYQWQHNRNPFIDYPQFVDQINDF